jgi:hypothetical protein
MDQKPDTQDIMIAKFGHELKDFNIRDVVRCIDDRHPVVVTDLEKQVTNKYLKKASLVILTLDKTDSV